MEQQPNRVAYVNKLFEFCKIVRIDDEFWKALEQHSNKIYIQSVKKFEKEEMAQKVFIFLEFIRDRGPCKEMIEILENLNQKDAAKFLREHNISQELENEGNEINLEVFPTLNWKSGGSKWYEMVGDPRGKCIIINNLMDDNILDTWRFKDLFEKLYFEVKWTEEEMCQNITRDQMWKRLEEFSKEAETAQLNALIVMIICHGQDENVKGYDGRELSIADIVDLFSYKKCPKLRDKPKLFFFNCCRDKKEPRSEQISWQKESIKYNKLKTIAEEWTKLNTNFLICYGCAEGETVKYCQGQMTDFGSALSRSIARYACEKSVQSILNIVCDKMSSSSPEVQAWCMSRELYFNPGYPERNKSISQ